MGRVGRASGCPMGRAASSNDGETRRGQQAWLLDRWAGRLSGARGAQGGEVSRDAQEGRYREVAAQPCDVPKSASLVTSRRRAGTAGAAHVSGGQPRKSGSSFPSRSALGCLRACGSKELSRAAAARQIRMPSSSEAAGWQLPVARGRGRECPCRHGSPSLHPTGTGGGKKPGRGPASHTRSRSVQPVHPSQCARASQGLAGVRRLPGRLEASDIHV